MKVVPHNLIVSIASVTATFSDLEAEYSAGCNGIRARPVSTTYKSDIRTERVSGSARRVTIIVDRV